MKIQSSTVQQPSSGAWYWLRFPEGWNPFTIRLDEVFDEEATGHYVIWQQAASALAKAWALIRKADYQDLLHELADCHYGFPRGRVVIQPDGAANVYWGEEKIVSGRRAIESRFGLSQATWHFDDHERAILPEKQQVRQLLGLTEDWPAVDPDDLFA